MRLKDMQYRLAEAVFRRKPYDDELRIVGGEGAFAVYRNNIFVSLIGGLRSLYPLTAKACGADFKDWARAYIESHPPEAPHLMHYGGDFPAFIGDKHEVAGQIAATERLCNLSYAAETGAVLTAETFLTYKEEERLHLPITLAVGCFISPPLTARLAEALCADEITERQLQTTENEEIAYVLITRPQDVVLKTILSESEAEFLQNVQKGNFAEALESFAETSPEPMVRLAHFFTVGAFALR